MNTYQRLIGYFYSYDNNVRNNCAGFAKFEMRENICRIMIKANICSRSGCSALIYGIYPYGDKLGLRILDRTIITRSGIELRLENVQTEQACTLLGILIRLSETRYYAATWSGSDVAGDDLILIPDGESTTKACDLPIPDDTERVNACTSSCGDDIYECPPDTHSPAFCNDEPVSRPAADMPDIMRYDNISVSPSAVTLDDDIADAASPVNPSAIAQDDDIADAASPVSSIPDISLPGSAPDNAVMDAADNTCCDTHASDRMLIFRICPRFYPFDDYEFSDCARLEPRDIGMLPPDMWGYINNSFLMHSYHCYGHLLLGRKGNSDDSEYYLMLPGINCRREAAMARKYGFPEFKSAKKTAPLPGAFGYWTVNLGKC